MRNTVAFVVALAVIGSFLNEANAQGWGSVKGQIVWPQNEPIPKPAAIVVPAGVACFAGLINNRVVIDEKSRGLKNVMIWIDTSKLDGKVGPIHPKLARPAVPMIVINQPACLFVERITMVRTDQQLQIANAAGIAHNTRILFNANESINVVLQSKGAKILKNLKPEIRPAPLACDMHSWMAGRVGVFAHPYFAVTDKDGKFEINDIPAGNFVVLMQHEEHGWQHSGHTKQGQPIVIKAGGNIDLGKVVARIPKD